MYRKNEQGTIYFTIIDKTSGDPITTGNVTARVIRDGVLHTTDTLTAGSNFISGTSVWKYDISTSGMNGDFIAVGLTHADGVPQIVSINTFEYDMEEVYDGISTLIAGVTVGGVGSTTVTSPTDFMASTAGLSTFNPATDFVTFGVPDVNIISVAGSGVTIGDFRAQNITAAVDGVVQANIVQVASSGVSAIEDFHVNTSGLSTFDASTDFVNVAVDGITAGGLATSAITKIVNGIFDQIIDGSITFEKLMEVLLAWMGGKVIVTDNGSDRTIRFFKRDGNTAVLQINVDETDSQEGQRSSTGTIS